MRAIVLIVFLVASVVPASAQSLADVARAEEARRKSLKTGTKVYTNDDLRGADATGANAPSPASAAPQAAPSKPAATTDQADAAKAKAEDPRKDEKYWRDRMTALRQSLSRNQVLADALQSRVNALKTDFVNRDDPIQRAGLEKDRQAALAEMDRVKQDTEKIKKSIADLEEEARRANVPPGWLR